MVWTEQTYIIHEIDSAFSLSGSHEQMLPNILDYNEKDRQKILDLLSKLSSQGEPYLFEVPLTTAKGNKKWIRTQAEAVFENGEIVRVIGTIMDITHEKTLESEKAMAIKQVQRNFTDLAILNDGIRNPLTVIVNLTELHCPELFINIVEQVNNIDAMVNQLDTRWVESESVLRYLQRHYNIDIRDDPKHHGD